ncbi:hypothetical protein DL93DRAFT_1883914 [Clavulina sp. PMI_390]|nr:hypothetical protein DL93DRAFT_1883914 [Clavulina sp. PMI_390]
MKTASGLVRVGTRVISSRQFTSRNLLHTSRPLQANPEPSEGHQLDPALQQLLRDVDFSLLKSEKARGKLPISPNSPVELEYSEASLNTSRPAPRRATEDEADDERTIEDDIDAWHNREEKMSTEARFGSRYIGLSSIPEELNQGITTLIAGSDKHQLRSDAKRLFLKPSSRESSSFDNEWTLELPGKFKENRKRKSARVTPREALAFTAIAIPGQFAAVQNVLRETKGRLGDTWAQNVQGVIDFGSGTGVAMWATLTEFQKPETLRLSEPINPSSTTAIGVAEHDAEAGPGVSSLAESSIEHYLLLENRRALLTISKTLTKDVSFGSTKVHQEDFWGEEGKNVGSPSENNIAIMAFTLTDLPTDLARKQMLRELWNTGADTMIVIDHATADGFAQVAAAREYLLKKGQQPPKTGHSIIEVAPVETDSQSLLPAESTEPPSIVGSHVVAPCPHDGPCPLTLLTKSTSSLLSTHSKTSAPPSSNPAHICSFSQRLERPAFLRLTKHASRGHEFAQYSYVVIRRGPRPAPPSDSVMWEAVEKKKSKWQERRSRKKGVLVEEASPAAAPPQSTSVPHPVAQQPASDITLTLETTSLDSPAHVRRVSRHWLSDAPPREMEDIRAESYYWPRILQTPLKRSGHVILETCTKEGNIARHTIPKSQGKQHYYDARKAKWGDAFPWESKNGADIRKRGRAATQLPTASGEPEENVAPVKGGEEPSDDTLMEDLEGEWELSFGEDGKPKMTRVG